jgi:hypothetical protein
MNTKIFLKFLFKFFPVLFIIHYVAWEIIKEFAPGVYDSFFKTPFCTQLRLRAAGDRVGKENKPSNSIASQKT